MLEAGITTKTAFILLLERKGVKQAENVLGKFMDGLHGVNRGVTHGLKFPR